MSDIFDESPCPRTSEEAIKRAVAEAEASIPSDCQNCPLQNDMADELVKLSYDKYVKYYKALQAAGRNDEGAELLIYCDDDLSPDEAAAAEQEFCLETARQLGIAYDRSDRLRRRMLECANRCLGPQEINFILGDTPYRQTMCSSKLPFDEQVSPILPVKMRINPKDEPLN